MPSGPPPPRPAAPGPVRLRGRVVVVDPDRPPLRDAVVEVRDGCVGAVRPAREDDGPPVADVLLPGFVDAHSHGRGIALSAHGFGGGPLERLIVDFAIATELDVSDESLVAGADALATGITCVHAIFHSVAAVDAYRAGAAAMAAGFAAAGVRAHLALGLTEQDVLVPRAHEHPDLSAPPGIGAEEVVAVARDLGPAEAAARVRVDAVGPVAAQWCGDAALRVLGTSGLRIHSHLLESRRQRLAPDGDPLVRLDRAGLLAPASCLAHGVWLTDAHVARLAATGSVVAHCPGSNARLGVGTCRVARLLESGVPVALGLDSNGATRVPDLFAELRAARDQALAIGQPLRPGQLLGMATVGGAAALGRDDLGHLRPGARGDVVALRLPDAVDAADPLQTIIDRGTPETVCATWIDGREVTAPPQAVDARRRSEAALARDAGDRARRRTEADRTWARVDAIWRAWEDSEGADPFAAGRGGL